MMMEILCKRPSGLTEVRRDGKDNESVIKVIKQEHDKCKENGMSDQDLCKHMETFSAACWVCMRNDSRIVQLVLHKKVLSPSLVNIDFFYF